MYDQYGKDGIYNNGHNDRHHKSRKYEDPFNGFGFAFRDPEDVFREFFGGTLFSDIFCKYIIVPFLNY